LVVEKEPQDEQRQAERARTAVGGTRVEFIWFGFSFGK
jgi:hypothetical protein